MVELFGLVVRTKLDLYSATSLKSMCIFDALGC